MNNNILFFDPKNPPPITKRSPLSFLDSLDYNTTPVNLALNYPLLTSAYYSLGIIQMIIKQPVDEAFKDGIIIESKEISSDEIDKIYDFLEYKKVLEKFKIAWYWKRLYGGGAILINGPYDPTKKLIINKGDKLNFIPINRWEIILSTKYLSQIVIKSLGKFFDNLDDYYYYYGAPIHPSKVLLFNDNEAVPHLYKSQLQGWGMPVLDSALRSVNQHLKIQNVIYELLDEAKVDVYKIPNLTNLISQEGGIDNIRRVLTYLNSIKNYTNSMLIDHGTTYEQKQISFGGISDIMNQSRIDRNAEYKHPMTKMYGTSAPGFNNGEENFENYYSMIETEIRSKCKMELKQLIEICMANVLGYVPNFKIKFHKLELLNDEQLENVKNQKFIRISNAYAQGWLTKKGATEELKKEQVIDFSDENLDLDDDFTLESINKDIDFDDKNEEEEEGKSIYKRIKLPMPRRKEM